MIPHSFLATLPSSFHNHVAILTLSLPARPAPSTHNQRLPVRRLGRSCGLPVLRAFDVQAPAGGLGMHLARDAGADDP